MLFFFVRAPVFLGIGLRVVGVVGVGVGSGVLCVFGSGGLVDVDVVVSGSAGPGELVAPVAVVYAASR